MELERNGLTRGVTHFRKVYSENIGFLRDFFEQENGGGNKRLTGEEVSIIMRYRKLTLRRDCQISLLRRVTS